MIKNNLYLFKKILYIFTRDLINKSNDGINFKIKDTNNRIRKYDKQKQLIVNSQNILFGNLLYDYYFVISFCTIIVLCIISYIKYLLYPEYFKLILINEFTIFSKY